MGTMVFKQQLLNTSLTSYPGYACDHELFLIRNLGCMVIFLIIVNACQACDPGPAGNDNLVLIRNLGCMVINFLIINASQASEPCSACDNELVNIRNLGSMVIIVIVIHASLASHPSFTRHHNLFIRNLGSVDYFSRFFFIQDSCLSYLSRRSHHVEQQLYHMGSMVIRLL